MGSIRDKTAAGWSRVQARLSQPDVELVSATPDGRLRATAGWQRFLTDRTGLLIGLALLAAAALTVRLWDLGVGDLVQAEHQKLASIEAWRSGDVFVDGEHPALFKAVILASTSVFGDGPLGLRLPNAILGAVSVALTALIARKLGGPIAGWTAGALMALGTIAVAIDRVGKEDTLMMALALGAILAWLYAEERPRLWILVVVLAAAAAAAKYFALPILPALLILGWLRMGPRPPWRDWQTWTAVVVLFLGAHLVLNPMIATPEQWQFIWSFAGASADGNPTPDGTLVPTTGFQVAEQIYASKPAWYYALYLGLKSQIVWTVVVGVGLVAAAFRFRRSDRFLLVWGLGYLVIISSVPFGFARYLAPAIPALAIVGGLGLSRLLAGRSPRVVAAAGAVLIIGLAIPLAQALPYPTLFVNPVGGGQDQALYWTPNDAVGNLGMAEAVAAAEELTPEGARVASADPSLIRFLTDGRMDGVAVENLPPSPERLQQQKVRTVIVQPSELSLGNQAFFEWIEREGTPVRSVTVEDLDAARVYVLDPAGRPR